MTTRRPPKAPPSGTPRAVGKRGVRTAAVPPGLAGPAVPCSSSGGAGPAVDMAVIDADVVLKESREKKPEKVFEINLNGRKVLGIANLARFPAVRTLKLGSVLVD